MTAIRETKNYNIFELLQFNRDVEKIKFLDQSMRTHGWIDAYPLHCVRNGGSQLLIKAGHHRFEVARMLGIPIKYVVCDDEATIYELERATIPWNVQDYLVSFARAGKRSYLKVKEYRERTGIGIGDCVAMLGGNSAGSASNMREAFKTGNFKLGNPNHAAKVEEIVSHCKNIGIKFATQKLFVGAISRIIWVDEININELLHKLATHSYIVTKQPTIDGYIRMIEDVYNRKRSKKVPIKILSDELAKKRSPIKK